MVHLILLPKSKNHCLCTPYTQSHIMVKPLWDTQKLIASPICYLTKEKRFNQVGPPNSCSGQLKTNLMMEQKLKINNKPHTLKTEAHIIDRGRTSFDHATTNQINSFGRRVRHIRRWCLLNYFFRSMQAKLMTSKKFNQR